MYTMYELFKSRKDKNTSRGYKFPSPYMKPVQCCQCDVNMFTTTTAISRLYASQLDFVAVAMNKQSM